MANPFLLLSLLANTWKGNLELNASCSHWVWDRKSLFPSAPNSFVLRYFELDSYGTSAKTGLIFHVTRESFFFTNKRQDLFFFKKFLLEFQISKIGVKQITTVGFNLHLSVAHLKKKKNKQSFHLSTKAREAHYDVHLLNIWQVEVELWGLCFNYKEFQMWRRAHKLKAELLKCLFFKGTKRVSICFSLQPMLLTALNTEKAQVPHLAPQ